jgi:hypothetical protein
MILSPLLNSGVCSIHLPHSIKLALVHYSAPVNACAQTILWSLFWLALSAFQDSSQYHLEHEILWTATLQTCTVWSRQPFPASPLPRWHFLSSLAFETGSILFHPKCAIVPSILNILTNHCHKWWWGRERELPAAPAAPRWSLSKETKSVCWRELYMPMLSAAVCTITKIGTSYQCPSVNVWIKKIWHIWNTAYAK